MTASVIRTVTIQGIEMDVIRAQGKLWLTARDLAMALEYKSESSIRQAFYRHRKNARLSGHAIKSIVGGHGGSPTRLFDETAIGFFCEYRKRPGSFELLRWLDAGGIREGGVNVATPLAETGNVVALKALPSTPPACQIERRKAYCRELLKTLLRYTTEDEADELVHVIEDAVRDLLSRRHCPGLNDARYDVYRRFWLQGGAV